MSVGLRIGRRRRNLSTAGIDGVVGGAGSAGIGPGVGRARYAEWMVIGWMKKKRRIQPHKH